MWWLALIPNPFLFTHFFFISLLIMNDKLKHKIIDYLNTEYSGMIPYTTEECEYYVFYFLEDKKIIVYNWATKEVHIRYSIIWRFLNNFFNLSDKEISLLMLEWLESNYKLDISKISTLNDYQFSWIRNLSIMWWLALIPNPFFYN